MTRCIKSYRKNAKSNPYILWFVSFPYYYNHDMDILKISISCYVLYHLFAYNFYLTNFMLYKRTCTIYFLWNHLSVLLSCTVFIFHSMRTCHAWNLGPNFKVKVAVTIWTLSVVLCKPNYLVSSFTNYKWSKLNLLYMLPMNCKCGRHILLKPD